MTDLSTLFIGPDGRGRDFRVRGEARAADADEAPGNQARALPLILARWAEAGESEAVASIVLAGGDALVLRARNQGRAESGYACYANAVIVPAAVMRSLPRAAEQVCFDVLAAIPEPNGTDKFARQPLALETLTPVVTATHNWDGLKARWHPRCVVTDTSMAPEAALGSILNAQEPAPGLAPFGWTSSIPLAALCAREGDIRLIVVPSERAASVPAGFEAAHMTRHGFDGTTFDLPLPIRIKARFTAQLEARFRDQAAVLINPEPAAGSSLTEQLFAAATAIIAPLDYDTGLAQSLRFAAIPATEFDGFFVALSRRLFAWFIELPHHKGNLRRTVAFLDEPGNQPLLNAIGSLPGYVLDSPILCQELGQDVLDRLTSRHNLQAVLKARRDLPRILTGVRPVVALAIYNALLSGADLPAETAQGLTEAARRLFARTDVGDFAAMLRGHLVPASLAKTRLVSELVMLIYQSDLPSSVRHG